MGWQSSDVLAKKSFLIHSHWDVALRNLSFVLRVFFDVVELFDFFR